jgi:methionyl-tRNA synthetase
MTRQRIYLSTTIPYVNARPHLGFALELVQADVLARHHRLTGDQVRLQTGTDDNSLKNVLAAEAEGIGTAELVDRNAAAFAALREPLALSFDDFIRTGSDPRHLPGVERLWRACAASGDLYLKHYEGLYCVGCEQFYKPSELRGGRCPEHGTEPQRVAEENWFFRLSRYADQLHRLISSGRLRIEPAARRNEVLGFIEGGLEDFSASRSTARARGWGIPVPDDPSQVIYVWWDALGNYVTALGYGTEGGDYRRWWTEADRRVHLVGKGVLRFHAVYWPAILLSAGEPLPTDILVHDYLTIGGNKISKSGGVAGVGGVAAAGAATAPDVVAAADPATAAGAATAADGVAGVGGVAAAEGAGGVAAADGADGVAAAGGLEETADPVVLVDRYGTDAVRWWLLREVPRVGDADFTAARLVARANADLANDLGNLVSRVVTLVHRNREGIVPSPPTWTGDQPERGPRPGDRLALAGRRLAAACDRAPERVASALAAFDFRAATTAIWDVVEEANRYAEVSEPWRLARAEQNGDPGAGKLLDGCLALLTRACADIGRELVPFLPDLAGRVLAACDPTKNRLPPLQPVFPRITGELQP